MTHAMIEHVTYAAQRLRNERRLRGAVCLICLVVFGLVLLKELHVSRSDLYGSDFHTFYTAALALRHGHSPFDPVDAWIRGYTPGAYLNPTYYVYTPFFALLIVPFTVLPFELAYLAWGLCNALFLLLAVFLLVRVSSARFSVPMWLAVTALVSLLPPVRFDLTWGESDIFLLCLLSVSLWAQLRNHVVLSGILLAVACVTKPPLLFLVAFLVYKRQIRCALVTVVAFLAFLLLPFVWLGGHVLRQQIEIWQFWSQQYVSFIDNQAPKGLFARLFSINPNATPIVDAPALVSLLWIVLAVVVLVVLAAVTRAPAGRAQVATLASLELGAALAALFLISPLTEYIYLSLAVIPLVSIALWLRQMPWWERRYRGIAIGLVAAYLLLCLPLQRVEYYFWPHMIGSSISAHVAVLLGAPYTAVLCLLFVLQTLALASASGVPIQVGVRELAASARDLRLPRALRAGGDSSSRVRTLHTLETELSGAPASHNTKQEAPAGRDGP